MMASWSCLVIMMVNYFHRIMTTKALWPAPMRTRIWAQQGLAGGAGRLGRGCRVAPWWFPYGAPHVAINAPVSSHQQVWCWIQLLGCEESLSLWQSWCFGHATRRSSHNISHPKHVFFLLSSLQCWSTRHFYYRCISQVHSWGYHCISSILKVSSIAGRPGAEPVPKTIIGSLMNISRSNHPNIRDSLIQYDVSKELRVIPAITW